MATGNHYSDEIVSLFSVFFSRHIHHLRHLLFLFVENIQNPLQDHHKGGSPLAKNIVRQNSCT